MALKPPWNVGGMVLITAAPRVYTRTHGPVLLNRASVVRFGFRAPTETMGTTPDCASTGPSPSNQGANAAGKTGRAVASLPAEHTTLTPHSPSWRRMP